MADPRAPYEVPLVLQPNILLHFDMVFFSSRNSVFDKLKFALLLSITCVIAVLLPQTGNTGSGEPKAKAAKANRNHD